MADVDPRSTPNFSGSKAAGRLALAELAPAVAQQQELLFAHGASGGQQSVLLVLQGMDTAGKGGILRHVVGNVDPQGVHITAFKAPTTEELSHHFLWRIRRALPGAGQLGVFDRSHYEDVLIARVRQLVPTAQWAVRYGEIRDFEAELATQGVTVIKVLLHISNAEQKARLIARLARPEKHWKYHPSDVTERALWTQCQEAYDIAVKKTATAAAPWYIVPADRKWYSRLAVMNLLQEHLTDLALTWPKADFDVAGEQRRLAAS